MSEERIETTWEKWKGRPAAVVAVVLLLAGLAPTLLNLNGLMVAWTEAAYSHVYGNEGVREASYTFDGEAFHLEWLTAAYGDGVEVTATFVVTEGHDADGRLVNLGPVTPVDVVVDGVVARAVVPLGAFRLDARVSVYGIRVVDVLSSGVHAVVKLRSAPASMVRGG